MGEWYDALPDALAPALEHWSTDAFRDELRAWCESVLGPVTAVEQHKLRGWATVWRVTTPDGTWFAKENCPAQASEVPLMGLLSRLAPDRVVPVTAARDGFLLTPDQGPTFYERGGDDLEAWVRLARDAALLQRELADHVPELMAVGMTLLPAERASDYVAARVDQFASLPSDDPRHLDGDVATRLRAHLPVVRRWAEEVTGSGLPVTLNHNDLHENNVFDVAGRLRFFDFGDALLTEPLGVLLVPLNLLAGKLEAAPDDPRLWRVADAALEVWSDLAPAAALRAVLPAALQLGRLGRVESWVRCQPSMTGAELADLGGAAAGWLGSLLEPPPLERV